LSQCGHFADQGGGVNLSPFYVDVFYGRPLIIVTFSLVYI